jgi:hypothetical protein
MVSFFSFRELNNNIALGLLKERAQCLLTPPRVCKHQHLLPLLPSSTSTTPGIIVSSWGIKEGS